MFYKNRPSAVLVGKGKGRGLFSSRMTTSWSGLGGVCDVVITVPAAADDHLLQEDLELAGPATTSSPHLLLPFFLNHDETEKDKVTRSDQLPLDRKSTV